MRCAVPRDTFAECGESFYRAMWLVSSVPIGEFLVVDAVTTPGVER